MTNFKNVIDASFLRIYHERTPINREWFYDFFNMLQDEKVDSKLIEKAFSSFVSQTNVDRCKKSKWFYGYTRCQSNEKIYFAYLQQLGKKMGDGFKDFLEKALTQTIKNFEESKRGGEFRQATCFALFTREVLKDNLQDVKIVQSCPTEKLLKEENGEIRASVRLGGLSLAELNYDYPPTMPKAIRFDKFYVTPGFEHLGIGKYLFADFAKNVANADKDLSILAYHILKDEPSSHFFRKIGGYPVKVKYLSQRRTKIDTTPLLEDEVGLFSYYYFSPEVVSQIAAESGPLQPRKEEPGLEM